MAYMPSCSQAEGRSPMDTTANTHIRTALGAGGSCVED